MGMNHCHDCNSTYVAPGTCNCYAPGGKRATAPVEVSPWRVIPMPFDGRYPCGICGQMVGSHQVHPCFAPHWKTIRSAGTVSGNVTIRYTEEGLTWE